MAGFVLLHGAFLGGWCWDLVVPDLEKAGFQVAAPDLPSEQLDAGWEGNLRAALASYPDDDDVVLVAHSRAGRLVPQLLERAPLRAVVLLSASIMGGTRPGPYRTDPFPTASRPPEPGQFDRDELGRTLMPEERARKVFFNQCTEERTEWALRRMRPQADLPAVPETRWPDVPVTYLAPIDDLAVDRQWMHDASRDRLGVTAVDLPGDHSPFLSRPAELAATLLGLV